MTSEEVRRVSSALFGHRYRLELLGALATADDGGVCVKELATARGVASSVFYPPLRSLVDIGLARRMPRGPADRRVFYARTRAQAWTGLRQMVQDLEVEIGERSTGSRTAL
jgi:DNA-binding IclR family transcriptional regulator